MYIIDQVQVGPFNSVAYIILCVLYVYFFGRREALKLFRYRYQLNPNVRLAVSIFTWPAVYRFLTFVTSIPTKRQTYKNFSINNGNGIF